MKVKIGKYKEPFTITKAVEGLFFFTRKKDEYGIGYVYPEWVDNITDFLYYGEIEPEQQVGEERELFGGKEFTWFAKLWCKLEGDSERKVSVHIDDCDIWSMDHTLGLIVLPMLKKLKEKKQGAPQVDLEDVPNYMHPSKEEMEAYSKDGKTDELFFDRWDYVLREMIFAFEHKSGEKADWEYEDYPDTGKMMSVKREDGNYEVKSAPRTPEQEKALEEHIERSKVIQERISNGFRLFGKYYEALWS